MSQVEAKTTGQAQTPTRGAVDWLYNRVDLHCPLQSRLEINAVPRVVSFIVLLGILLLLGTMFFQVMIKFVVPLFIAAVLAVIFKPLHEWVNGKLPDRPRVAALSTTVLIVITVLLPAVTLGWRSYVESRDKVASYLNDEEKQAKLVDTIDGETERLKTWYRDSFGEELNVKGYLQNAGKLVTEWALSGVKAVFGLLVGLAITTFALYYYLADGPAMLETLMRLSPLDDAYERELLDKFANVSRAVVVASMLSAIVQGLLAGIGYFFALQGDPPIALLTMLTMVLALVPFVGATAIWLPVTAWIYFIDGSTTAAIGLGAYCAVVVSMIDNVIKPFVLHGQSNLHPLLALISVLGGIQVLGPIGILVGPMLVAFLQAILNMVHKELHLLGTPGNRKGARASRMHPSVQLQAEAAAADEQPFDWPLGGSDHGQWAGPSGPASTASDAEAESASAPPPSESPQGSAAKRSGAKKRRRKR